MGAGGRESAPTRALHHRPATGDPGTRASNACARIFCTSSARREKIEACARPVKNDSPGWNWKPRNDRAGRDQAEAALAQERQRWSKKLSQQEKAWSEKLAQEQERFARMLTATRNREGFWPDWCGCSLSDTNVANLMMKERLKHWT